MTLYTHDYEYAFNHYRPDYIGKGEKNVMRYSITGLRTNGYYFRFFAKNRKEVEEWLNDLRNDVSVNPDSIAIQNRFGQLLWTSENGIVKESNAPQYMNSKVDGSDQCFYPGFWRDHTDKF